MMHEALHRIKNTQQKSLEYLDLSQLDLLAIPLEILEVRSIKALSLSHNQISDLSVLAKLSNLHKIALSHNHIKDISVLSSLPKLRFIFLAHNHIHDLSTLHGHERLKKLVVSHNNIAQLPDLSHYTQLAYLDITANPLKAPSLEVLQAQLPHLKIYKR